jgi:hypothetical protein
MLWISRSIQNAVSSHRRQSRFTPGLYGGAASVGPIVRAQSISTDHRSTDPSP